MKNEGDPAGRFELVVEYDFILAFGPGPKPPIYFQKIVDFLFWLRNECGFMFGNITADQYQSQMLIQALKGQRLNAGHLSVDINKAPYEAWRKAIEAHQIRLYPHPILLREAEFLQELDRKFDHPAGGSKDLTDVADTSEVAAKEARCNGPLLGREVGHIRLHRRVEVQLAAFDQQSKAGGCERF
jgi:hypothetical protein